MEGKEQKIEQLANKYYEMMSKVELPDMDVDDLLDLIDYYTRLGMDFEAEMYKRIAAMKFPTHPDVILMCAHWEADEGNWNSVHKICSCFDSTRYDDALFDMERYLRMMLPSDAFTKMKSTISPILEEDDYDFLFDSAQLFKDFGYMQYAVGCLKEIPQSYPDYRQTLEMAAECYFYMADYGKSLEELDKAIDFNSFDEYLWAQTALLHYKNKDYAKSLDACEYSLAIRQDNPRADHIKKLLQWQTNSGFDLASAFYIEQDYSLMMEVGNLHYQKKEYQQAEAEYMAAGYFCPRGNRDRIQIAFKTAMCRVLQGRAEEGIATLLSVANQGVDLWPYALELIQLLLKNDKTQLIAPLIQPLMKLDDISLSRIENLISLFTQFKCYEVVRFFWEQAFTLESELKGIHLDMVHLAKDVLNIK